MMTKGANGVRKMGPNRKGKGVLIGHRPKVGPKILKPINSNGETSGLNQKKFDDGSSMAHDKVDKVIDVGGFNPVQISNHLNAKNHQAIQVGADKIVSRIGMNRSFRIEANGFAGGIWILWNESIAVDIVCFTPQLVHMRIMNAQGSLCFLCTAVYAIPQSNRIEGASISQVGRKWFQEFIFNNGLRDLGYSGPKFMWSKGFLSQRLDRAICNSEWDSFAPNCLVHNLYRLESNHKPVLVSFKPEPTKGFVKQHWRNDEGIMTNVERFQIAIQDWNKKFYGNLFVRKQSLLTELNRVQKILNLRTSKLKEVLKHEELLLFQKSRTKWLNYGVRNTSYFHKCSLARQKRSRIDELKIGNNWVFDGEEMKKHEMEFFKDLYSINYSVCGVLPCHGAFPKITSVDKDGLLLTISNDEIHREVFGMSPLKTPSIDGFHAKIYQSN
ncbi:hypothetical protein ES332_D09G048400v1 [Gossypium tomentosum]|uniref:Endonuclease/exonuclease/phosphatase domain-containing protein n=1 Tax=Gossypium tomentosum TaxID=34277 RepID=A0A5D2JCT5_GOSTO|nr:hypothetical protein ES332_D09G048400v1 [Gossypium tomentosum]